MSAVAWRLLTANRTRCPHPAPQPGLVIYAADQYAGRFRTFATDLFGLARGPAVAAVAPGSAAERVGLRSGDVLRRIDDVALPQPAADAAASFAGVQAVHDRLEEALARGDARLDIERNGRPMRITLPAELGCPTLVQLVPSGKRNAEADGRTVTITSAIVDLTADDDELAAPIAHEIAHNILGHRAALARDGISKGVFAGFGSNGQRLRRTEAEADMTGVELMAAAGYDPSGAVRFWRRYGPASAELIGDGTHPGWRKRLAAIAAKVDAIKATSTSSGVTAARPTG